MIKKKLLFSNGTNLLDQYGIWPMGSDGWSHSSDRITIL